MDIDEVADELYGLDPADFVEIRTARVKEARESGDKVLAKEISTLRRPTLVAWLVNMLAREHSDEIESLLELGEALRHAQRHLAGDDLRRLTTQRQQVVRAMAQQAAALAVERGQKPGETALREVGQSLHAALADPEIAEQVRSGRLVTAVSYSGMGPAGLAVVGGGSRKPKATVTQKEPDPAALQAARAAVAEAEAAERDAESALQSARSEAVEATTEVDETRGRVDDLGEQLAQAEQERQFARRAEQAAADHVAESERDLEAARQRVRASRDDVAALE